MVLRSSASSPLQFDLNGSFDLHALESYRNAVFSVNFKTYELPVIDNQEDDEADLEDQGPVSVVGMVTAQSRILREEFEYLKTSISKKKIERGLRDKKRQLQYNKLRHMERCTEFEANVNKGIVNANFSRNEVVFRWIGRLNSQIHEEKEFRKRLKLPKTLPLFLSVDENFFPDLSDEAIRVVQRAWNEGSDHEIFSEDFGVKITRKDLKTLRGLNWLNDEIINFYLNLIMRRSEQNNALPKVYAFNTFFYRTLSDRGFAGVKRWTRKVDVFSYDVILVPVHMGNHWCMSSIDFTRRSVQYFDSLGGKNSTCLRMLGNYLMEEHRDKKASEFDISDWSFDCPPVPMQMNGSDCGVFSSLFAEFTSRLCAFQFDQRIMPYFRQRMVYEISSRTLMI